MRRPRARTSRVLHMGTFNADSEDFAVEDYLSPPRRRSVRRTGRSGRSSSACPDRSSSSEKTAPFGNSAVQRQPDPDGRFNRLLVHDWQRARQTKAHRADLMSGSAPNAVEHPQNILEIVLSSTCTSRPSTGSGRGYRFLVWQDRHRAAPGSGKDRAAARPRPVPALLPALHRRGTAGRRRAVAPTCRPTGNPSSGASPTGKDALALPARLDGIVQRRSCTYAGRSSTFSPILKAVIGVDGETHINL